MQSLGLLGDRLCVGASTDPTCCERGSVRCWGPVLCLEDPPIPCGGAWGEALGCEPSLSEFLLPSLLLGST